MPWKSSKRNHGTCVGGRCTLVLLNMDLEGNWLSGILIKCFTVCNFIALGMGLADDFQKERTDQKMEDAIFLKEEVPIIVMILCMT